MKQKKKAAGSSLHPAQVRVNINGIFLPPPSKSKMWSYSAIQARCAEGKRKITSVSKRRTGVYLWLVYFFVNENFNYSKLPSPKDAAFFRSKNIDLRPNGGEPYMKNPGYRDFFLIFLEENSGYQYFFFFFWNKIPGTGILPAS